MKWLILVNQGIESLAANELTAFGAKILEKNPACITIEISIEKIVMIAYKFQTINRILSFIASFSFTSIDDVEAKLDKIKINEITPSQTFAARSEQQKTEILSAEVQPLVGKIIAEKTEAKVNLSNPDVMIFTFINENKAYIGIDLTGDISKRDYRIFLQRDKLKATIAYAALVFAEWHPHLSLIDPFCNTGIIPIEAALAATG